MFGSFNTPSVRLGELLVQRKMITPAQLEDAVRQQSINTLPLGEILILNRMITRRQMKRCLKWQAIVRVAALVTSFTLAPMAMAQAGGLDKHGADPFADTQVNYLDDQQGDDDSSASYNRPSGTQVLSLLLAIDTSGPSSYGLDRGYPVSQPAADGNMFTQFTADVKHYIGAPMVTLLSGEYKGGVDSFTQGLAYKANWSERGAKVNVNYQF